MLAAAAKLNVRSASVSPTTACAVATDECAPCSGAVRERTHRQRRGNPVGRGRRSQAT